MGRAGDPERRTGSKASLLNGDVDGDNEVSLSDFAQMVSAFGTPPGGWQWKPNADLDGDEEVTLSDLSILIKQFGRQGEE